jgi:hypothetical protein
VDSKKKEKIEMNHACHNNIVKALKIAEALMDTANKGEATSGDDSCRVLFGVIRDCGYKILKQAEQQRQVHKAARDR